MRAVIIFFTTILITQSAYAQSEDAFAQEARRQCWQTAHEHNYTAPDLWDKVDECTRLAILRHNDREEYMIQLMERQTNAIEKNVNGGGGKNCIMVPAAGGKMCIPLN